MSAKSPAVILDMIVGLTNPVPPEQREAGEPEELNPGMLADVAYIGEAIEWAWIAAFEVSTQQRERGVVHREKTPEELRDPDLVRGQKFEIPLGDYRAQEALRRAAPGLVACDALLERACLVVPNPRAPRQRRLPVPVTIDTRSLAEYRLAVLTVRWRLHYVADHAISLESADVASVLVDLRKADDRLAKVRGGFEDAHRHATRDASISTDRLCITCTKRPVRKAGNECGTCANYRWRHGGEPRPTSLDGEDAA